MTNKSRRILVAEDSPTQAERIRYVLEGQGYKVEVVQNGRDGLAAVQARRPDLIVSDVVMPETDGFAFCQAIKSSKATWRIPFVLLTSQQTPMDILRGLERGADNFIAKPFEDEYLLERIRRIFENLERRKQGGLEMEVTVRMGGREIVVNADKQQMIELLFSTSEELSESNKQLEEARLALEEQARGLERTVEERTRELREAEAKYRTLVEHIPAVVYTADATDVGQLLSVSPHIETVLGFPADACRADPELLTRHIHPDDRARVLEAGRRVRATGEPATTEFRAHARDGRVVWLSDVARRVQGEGGADSFVQGFLLDITERKRAEEALRDQRLFLRQVLDLSPSFIFAKDRDGRFTLANQAVADAYGCTVEALIGKADAELSANAAEVEGFRRDDLDVLSSGQDKVTEEAFTDAAGQRRWLYTVRRALAGPDGRTEQVLGVATDVTASPSLRGRGRSGGRRRAPVIRIGSGYRRSRRL